MTIFEEINQAGIEFDHHYSDLYFPKNPVTDKIISRYEYKRNVKTFKDNITRKIWYDVPFAYDPYFEQK